MRLDCGVSQNSPVSPFLFILVTEMALASLYEFWAERGLGYFIDGLWVLAVAYSDDVCTSGHEHGITNFTSTVACQGESLGLSARANGLHGSLSWDMLSLNVVTTMRQSASA